MRISFQECLHFQASSITTISYLQPVRMSTPREGQNPLRPYYIAPSIGPTHTSTRQNAPTARTSAGKPTSAGMSSLGSSTRNLLADLDYGEILGDGSPSLVEMLKGLVDQGLWRYTSVLLAQPFDIAKTILQVQLADAVQEQRKSRRPDVESARRASLRDRVYEV